MEKIKEVWPSVRLIIIGKTDEFTGLGRDDIMFAERPLEYAKVIDYVKSVLSSSIINN